MDQNLSHNYYDRLHKLYEDMQKVENISGAQAVMDEVAPQNETERAIFETIFTLCRDNKFMKYIYNNNAKLVLLSGGRNIVRHFKLYDVSIKYNREVNKFSVIDKQKKYTRSSNLGYHVPKNTADWVEY